MTAQQHRPALSARAAPAWFTDAKLGVVVHWGLYSIPAFAEDPEADFSSFMRDLSAGKDTRGRIPYAEFYLNSLRIAGSRTARHHAATYGTDFSYFDFQAEFDRNAAGVDLAEWAELFARTEARYVVMVTRHLDGYPLWPTQVHNPHVPSTYRSSRDLVGDLTEEVRARGMRMGLYYGGGLDWTFTDAPIRTMTDMMRQQGLGAEYARYATAQWRELIETYQPSILWNDMGWPAESEPAELFADYYARVPDGVVNDRWTQVRLPGGRLARAAYLRFVSGILKLMAAAGRPLPTPPSAVHSDFETHEYQTPAEVPSRPWELIRGFGKSFGYSAEETAADSLTGTGLVHLLADVVAFGGNLLINVGPDGTGQIPDLQRQPLTELGDWLRDVGEAIFDTRPWINPASASSAGDQVRFTCTEDALYAIVLAEEITAPFTLPGLGVGERSLITWLGEPAGVAWTAESGGLQVLTPPEQPHPHAQVLTISPPPRATKCEAERRAP